ncbi:hypothetical protein DPMN_160937 [Dreissena polymorpha]|uniref:Uncharacterized protein n=1 Tax=Dreissena polymorpha TaxID=45954 RepID=A0A9D4EN37_DREPO|nr:hypothetical protein DPMN_160937 [Dreissena polymorpha]
MFQSYSGTLCDSSSAFGAKFLNFAIFPPFVKTVAVWAYGPRPLLHPCLSSHASISNAD